MKQLKKADKIETTRQSPIAPKHYPTLAGLPMVTSRPATPERSADHDKKETPAAKNTQSRP
jgi:hypothetical protein